MNGDSQLRSLAKTLSWRVLATLATATLVWLMTDRLDLAIAVGAWEAGLKMLLYFLHERLWDRITLGRGDLSVAIQTPEEQVSGTG